MKVIFRFLKKISNDDSTLVKKELAFLLKDFCTSLEDDFIVELITNVMEGKNEFAKIPIFDVIVALQDHKSLSKLQEFIYTLISNLSTDECWRVRYIVADKIHEVIFILT